MGDWGDGEADVPHVIPDDSTGNKRTPMDWKRGEVGSSFPSGDEKE